MPDHDPGPALVLLVHGAWHGAWCWAPLQSELDRRGVASLAIDLPGHGLSREDAGDLADDVRRVHDALASIGEPVVLVGHSYGGAVVTGAVGGAHNVVALVYLTAFAMLAGECINDVIRAVPTPDPVLRRAIVMRDDGSSVLDPEHVVESLYANCPPPMAEAAIRRLGPPRMSTFGQPVESSPLGARPSSVPTTYVRCTADNAIPVAQQDVMAARCDEVVSLDTDHSPFASATDAVADVIEHVARGGRTP
jgi:pimeloyl-ACP methyl ester carboxylesterase